MRQIKGIDALQLYLDAPHQPINSSTILLFDRKSQRKKHDFEIYRDLIQSRLQVAEVFRQRLVQVPLNLDFPYWVNDPEFDLDFHIHHFGLSDPGGWKELKDLYSHLFAIPLDRSRPLWEMYFVEGLNAIEGLSKGSFAIIFKVHHVAMDGLSGAQVLDLILDSTPKPKEMPEDAWAPEPIPTDQELLKKVINTSLKRPSMWKDVLYRLSHHTEQLIDYHSKKGWKQLISQPAPKTRFGGNVTPHRVWDGATFSLERIRAIGKAIDKKVTINDVYLTLCSLALRKYLMKKNELPDNALIASVPVSIRSAEQNYTMGNRVSQMSIRLATNIEDPIQCLKRMHKNTASAKEYFEVTHPELGPDSLQIIPPFLAETGMPVFQQRQNMNLPVLFNLSATNIPGPRQPLYALGCELKQVYFASAVYDGLGLVLAAFSYHGNLSITVTSCREMMPDPEVFIDNLKKSFDQLESLLSKNKKSSDT